MVHDIKLAVHWISIRMAILVGTKHKVGGCLFPSMGQHAVPYLT